MTNSIYDITDDTGAIAIVDPDAYASFVSEEWEIDKLDAHFKAEMAAKHLLIWETGVEATWRIQVHFVCVDEHGSREVTGPIITSQGRLLLTSYNSLTMAAQFRDVTLPEPHERNQVFIVPPGEYRCCIVHMHDLDLIANDAEQHAGVNYHIEIVPSDGSVPVWDEPPWASHVLKQWLPPEARID